MSRLGGQGRWADLILVRYAGLAKCHYRDDSGCGDWTGEARDADLRREWVLWPASRTANGGS
jgi:hypothetical protein